MAPLFAHDPLDALQRGAHPGWLLAPATALSVACEHWVLALLALALYAWLERDVPAVLRSFVPLVLALAVGVALVAAGARAGALAGWGVRAVPSGHALWGATFAVYTFRVYGPKTGLLAAFLALAGGAARIYLGSNGVPSVGAGWVIGALIGGATYAIAARVAPGVWPNGRRARLESMERRGGRDGAP